MLRVAHLNAHVELREYDDVDLHLELALLKNKCTVIPSTHTLSAYVHVHYVLRY